jgi:hemerythrin-like domain-containing protein
MRLIDELQAEHELIDAVAGAFLAHVSVPPGTRCAEDTSAFVRFFRRFAGDFHHAREEDTLFVALRQHAGLPGDRGPIAVMLADHQRMAGLLDQVEGCLRDPDDEEGRARLREPATAYVHALWRHIDAENSVLFPECAPRLGRNGVKELPSRAPTAEEASARLAGEDLRRRYPPSTRDEIMRGEGCIMCPAFGVSCRGIEHEWWNEWEWDEFEDRMSGI